MATHSKNATVKPPPPGNRAGSGASDAVLLASAERLLRIGEVARLLRISRNSVYYMVRSGGLPSLRISNMTRVRAGDLRDYIRLHNLREHKRRSRRRGRQRSR